MTVYENGTFLYNFINSKKEPISNNLNKFKKKYYKHCLINVTGWSSVNVLLGVTVVFIFYLQQNMVIFMLHF